MGLVSGEIEKVVQGLSSEVIEETELPSYESDALLKRLNSLGTDTWIDTGDLDLARSIWKQEFSSLTTNNTLANQVVQTGILDETIQSTVDKLKEIAPDLDEADRILEIGFVINCKIALRLVKAFKKKVSVELHPAVSRDIEKTVEFARRYQKVCPEYFIIKIPLTPEGYLSVRKLRKEGMPINFTLGFSARQNYLAARLSNPDFVNVFLGRLNQVVIDNEFGTGKGVGERVTLATQESITELRSRIPEITTQLIAASIRNGDQVAALAGVDVQTIPPKALTDFLKSNLNPEDLSKGKSEEWNPEANSEIMGRLKSLWEVSESFKKFSDELIALDSLDTMNGEDLIKFCEKFKVDLFRRFSEEDLKLIYYFGKIPRLKDWPDSTAVDDLMTQSALGSFAKDQNALDDRIRSFLK
jgi:transaldolase